MQPCLIDTLILFGDQLREEAAALALGRSIDGLLFRTEFFPFLAQETILDGKVVNETPITEKGKWRNFP